MKLKEVNRTAIQSWSPAQHHPVYLAAGTSAQQLDASFSTTASLEIFELDLAEPSLDMKLRGAYSSSHRYHKLAWGPHGMDAQGLPSGVLIAGGENGDVILYDPAKIIAGDSDVVIAQNVKHSGPVRALDVNSFQTNLVASGGNESEIYIWDLNNFGSPMTPGPKTQPLEDISCVAWNRQVQHILASASPSGRASIWDLRKNDLIIKVSDHSNRMHCSGLEWNPEVATQLVLASEDDRMPVIQMWDLRFSTSPLKVLENHTRGVLAIAWSVADPELLLSCGKDNRILCWNPNTAEVLYELPTSTQWCFDIQWCPRNPAVLSAAAFDGHISVYSIMGGSSQAVSQTQADTIGQSFGNMDPFGMGQTLPPLQLPQAPAGHAALSPLKKPPKWLRRPVGASFAFGGKLVSLENTKLSPEQPQQPVARVVHISQVVTETAFLERSAQLQATLAAGGFADFCQKKIGAAQNEFEKTVWAFLKVNFENDARGKYLELLGYKKEELAAKIAVALEEKPIQPKEPLADLPPQVALDDTSATLLQPTAQPELVPESEPEDPFDLIAAGNLRPAAALEMTGALDPAEAEVDLTEPGNLEAEAGPVVEEQTVDEAIPLEEEPAVPVDAEVVASLPEGPLDPAPAPEGIDLTVSQDVDGLITQALLTGNFEGAVELCLHDNRMADSIILAIAGGAELLKKTQQKYFTMTHSKITKLISAVVTEDWRDVLQTCELQNWKEALAAVMTYAHSEEFSSLCDLLGCRLEAAEDERLQTRASLCYICSGNVEKLVSCWTGAQDGHCPLSLQDLMEKVVVLRRAVDQSRASGPSAVGHLLGEKMSQYASLLASQGNLTTAIAYLPHDTEQVAVQQLRDRLSRALGQPSPVSATAPTPVAQVQPQPLAPHPTGGQPRPLFTPTPQPGTGQQRPLFAPAQPPMVPQQPAPTPAPVPTSVPSQPQYYQPAEQTPAMYGAPPPGSAAPPASSSAAFPPMFSHQYQRPQNGWNDPPNLTRDSKKKKVPENYTPPAPITAPIFSPLGAGDPQAQQPHSMPPQAMAPDQTQIQTPYQGMQQQMAPPIFNPGLPKTRGGSVEGAPGAPIGEVIQSMQSIPAEKITKKPIPAEHLVLKNTFEGLIQKCLAAATDPQTKRKLDDAHKRLEALYDKLREQTLSPAIVGGLHNIVQCIDSRSYMESLNIHTHIVSSSNFSETSAFMPVLKVVLTQANKLGV
uniref:Protein transport protein Sec31A n=1 Tax=Esox lucius TaxID=8010 RepID=A0A3P8XBA2_ESOLU